jgi:ankyrin repeat protein
VDTDPPFKHLLFVAPFIMCQNIGILAVWIVLTAYIREYVILCIFLLTGLVYLTLQGFVFRWTSNNMATDAILNGVDQPDEAKRRSQNVFFVAIVTSWISPCSVWCNNIAYRAKKFSWFLANYFLLISSISCVFSLTIAVLSLYAVTDGNIIMQNQTNVPVLHCFNHYSNENSTIIMLSNLSWNFICYSEDRCKPVVRLCGEDEEPTDVLRKQVIPSLLTMLLLSLLSSICLQFLGDYKNMFFWSRFVSKANPLLHHSFIKDNLEIISQYEDYYKFYQYLSNLSNASDIINQADTCLGNTCLHEAFYNGLFYGLQELITLGGNIFLQNKKGESVSSLMNIAAYQTIKNHIELNNSDVYLEERFEDESNEMYLFQLIILECVDKNNIRGKALLLKNYNEEIWSWETKRETDIVVAKTLFERAKKEILESLTFSNVSQMLNNKLKIITEQKSYIKHLFVDVQEIESRKTEIRNLHQSYVWKTPPLQWAMDENKEWLFDFLRIILGARLEAMNSEGDSPLRSIVTKFLPEIDIEKDSNKKKNILWFALTRGGVIFTKTYKDLDKTLQLLSWKLRNRELDGKTKLPNFEKIFLHACSKGDHEILDYFLTASYSLNSRDENKRNCLHLAIINGSVPTVSKLLQQQSINLNQQDLRKRTPLHYAIDGNSENIEDLVLVLIHCGANVNIPDSHGNYPLHLAAQQNNKKIILDLLDADAELDFANSKQQTPLHIFVSAFNDASITKLLFGKSINAVDEQYRSALHLAVMQGSSIKLNQQDFRKRTPLHYVIDENSENIEKLVHLLILYGANVNIPDIHGNYPLHLAAKQINKKIIQLLLNAGAGIDFANLKKQTPLHIFVSAFNDSSITSLLIGKSINAVDEQYRSALHLATIKGFDSNVKALIEHGANPICLDYDGNFPVDYAVQNQSSACSEFFSNFDFNCNTFNSEQTDDGLSESKVLLSTIVKKLLKEVGIDNSIGIKNGYFWYALSKGGNLFVDTDEELDKVMEFVSWKIKTNEFRDNFQNFEKLFLHACKKGELLIIEYFLKIGQNLNGRDFNKRTCLHLAVMNGSVDAVRLIVKHADVDINAQDINLKTPLHYALEKDCNKCQEMFLQLLPLSKKLNVNIADIDGNYPLHLAAKQRDNKIIIQFLLSAGASQDVTNEKEQTPLHIFVSIHDNRTITELLIGKNINKVDKNLRTALHLSAMQGFHSNVETLIDYGANPCLPDKLGNIPLKYGILSGSVKCQDLIGDNMRSKIQNEYRLQCAIREMDVFSLKGLLPLIDHVNFFDKDGQTPLHLAADNDDFEIMQILMENQANPNLRNKTGQTPIHILAMHGRTESMKLLLKHENANVQVTDNFLKTPKDLARSYGQTACVTLLNEYILAEKFKKAKPQP